MRGQQFLAAGLIGSAALLAAGVLPAQAQSGLDGRVQGLERRMDGLESGMQEMLRMMREQQQQGRAAPQSQNTPPSLSFHPGRLSLGVCALSGPIPDECPGLPTASVVVPVPRAFGFDEALRNSQLVQHLNPSSREATVGLAWGGVLRITQTGVHNFQLNLQSSQPIQMFNNVGCQATIVISDRIVARSSGWLRNGVTQNTNISGQGRVELGVGLHTVRIFLGCSLNNGTGVGDIGRLYQLVSVALDLAEPGEAAFRPLQADRLGMRQ